MYQRILVPVDGSSTSARGLAEAIRLAQLTGGRLRLVHVIDELSFALAMDAYAGYAGNWLEELRAKASVLLQEGRAEAASQGVEADVVLCDSVRGAVHDQVIAQAVASHAELIVIGTHGRRGLGRLVMGSSAEHILRMSPVPVLLIRAPEEPARAESEHFTLPAGEVASQ
ncbi:universal stress protein [Variovorax sp. GB1R11]|uniref:universal stress protein n=1 Tax=Variovorax sp. GB1R11 TaxID=3443741 RepID=UPI003F4796CB